MDYRSASSGGFQAVPVAYAAVTQIIHASLSVPLYVYMEENGADQPQKGHDTSKLLRKPNPDMGGVQFYQRLIGDFTLGGEVFIHKSFPKTGPNTGKVRRLRPMLASTVDVIIDMDTEKKIGYSETIGGKVVKYGLNDVIHIHNYNPLHPHRGISPLIPAAISVSKSTEIDQYHESVLKNGLRPSGMFVAEDGFGEQGVDEFRDDLDREYSGSMKGGLPLLMSGNIKYHQLSMNPTDMDFINGSKLTKRDIAIVFNVSPEIVGDSEAKTYSNYAEGRKALYMEAVLPRLTVICDGLTTGLNLADGEFIYFDTSGVPALSDSEDSLWKRAVLVKREGIITSNEARERLGFNRSDDPNADVLETSKGSRFDENNEGGENAIKGNVISMSR